jgi:aerotaxis receptor
MPIVRVEKSGWEGIATRIEPIDESRVFAVEELFFSTTDLNGRIQRANGVFQRIADYSWEELNNQPHNIIRHPDMPRVVFQILWDHIQAGRPIAALIKNLAHDGRYYWVVALVVPIPGGYLSVRFKPTSPLLGAIERLYEKLKAIEASIEKDAKGRKAAMAASREALDADLRVLGFSSYDDFMQKALKLEMQSRDAHLSDAHPSAAHLRAYVRPSIAPDSAIHSAEFASLETAAEAFDKLLEVLNVLFSDLEVYVEINKSVRVKSLNVMDISEALRVSALNGVIAVDRLGSKASGLRPVLDWLRRLSGDITQEGVRLSESLDELVLAVDRVVFDLCAAKLQIEMTAQFAHELVNDATLGGLENKHNRMTEGAIGTLHASSCETVGRALSGLAAIQDRLKILTESQIRLLNSSHSLRPIYLTGRIEMAEGEGHKLATIFKDVGEQMEETIANLSGLKNVLQELDTHLVGGVDHAKRVEQSMAGIRI